MMDRPGPETTALRQPPHQRSRRSLLINALLVAIAFTLLGLAVWSNREQVRDVLHRGVDPWVFATAFAIYLTGLVLTFARWYVLVRALGLPFTIHDAVRLGFIGNVFNLVIPGAIGGDLIKAAYLSREQAKKTQAIASMVIDRILGLLGLFLIAGVAGVRAWPRAGAPEHRLIVVVWVAVALGLLALAAIFGQALTRNFPHLLEGHGRLAIILAELKALSDSYRQRLGVVAACLALSSFIHALNVVAFYVVSQTLFASNLPSLADHFLIVPLVLFSTAVPLPFGALGVSENVSSELFRLVGHPGGALAMMGFRVLMYCGGLVSACVYLANLRQVRTLTATAEHLEEDLLEEEAELDPSRPAGQSLP